MTRRDAETPAVAIYAPVGRDGPLTRDLLLRIGVDSVVYPSLTALCESALEDAGAILLTEEALECADVNALVDALAGQPAWSDIPVLVFAGGDRSGSPRRTVETLDALTNVTMIERPIRVAGVFSIVRAALRARARQYDMRDVLVSLHGAREQAERASRLKDEFLATLSHELRTPLNAILGWTSMLRQKAVAADTIAHVLEIVERNATAQSQLVADVLDVSRMITGKIRLNVRPVSMPDLIRDAIDTVRPGADARGISIAFERGAEPVVVSGDAERLRQVVWNLLSNAVKFSSAGGQVRVELARHGSVVETAVSDRGAGIAPEFLPYVFDRFRQADQTFTRAHGGLGLGLAIVKQIVEMHGGSVSADSPGAGRGAVFRVRLPIAAVLADSAPADAPPTPAPAEARAVSPGPDLSDHLLLIVDDDAATRELMIAILTREGARVQTAASAQEAIDRLDAEVPALIVADIGMPVEDGLSFVRRLRRRPAERGGRVPAIALSAYARAEDRAAALAAGFDAFIAKPAAPGDLLATIDDTLRGAHPREAAARARED
jgi:signal transduction histidine kinase/ActR/RegA family two-component response regulator